MKLATALVIALAACHDTRIETVTINPTHEADHVQLVAPILGAEPRETGYLDEGVSAFRIQLVIKDSDKQPSFTARLYANALDEVERTHPAALGTYRLAPPTYVLVEGDSMERKRLHMPDDKPPPPTTPAVEVLVPTTTFEHHHSYALQLYGAADQLIAGYELATN